MTVKELEKQLERLAVADLDAGQLDAAVGRLGQLAALELMAEEAAREPGALALSDAGPVPSAVWADAVERARDQAWVGLGDALDLINVDIRGEPARRRHMLLPMASLGVLVIALLLVLGVR
jgi:hypothetical protein